ncbi:uncharacterized protein LOC106175840 [Lingula anatina]|uniref:Uncharacterized protein LOC106175840 n=1 Tax=Lingula anatina TaxID=7574 RepID=A0A1S3JSZ6_LINAN|nr:uncharacterized protein LOC106175840 [Lingula anatina]|eukprot:XP_013413447.1 uncharacterized protein LOC106175840 [Lingula anatina]
MGAGASKGPAVGVPVNPRVQYTDELAQKEGKTLVIDAPNLMDLNHGTVRYRYVEDETAPKKKQKRTEKPHEVDKKQMKHGYFYHAKLNDYSEDAGYQKEDSFKFCYVNKGPESAKKKKLYYVYGKGLNARDTRFDKHTKEDKPQGIGYAWPKSFRQPHHVYYQLIFVKQDAELPVIEGEDEEEEDVQPEAEISEKEKVVGMKVKSSDSVKDVKSRLAIRLLKSVDHIHLSVGSEEARDEDQLQTLRKESDGEWKRFRIQLMAV